MALIVDEQAIPLSADGLPAGMPTDYDVPTLGWGVLGWAEAMLAQPDGETAGEPWRWTDTQARIVAWWYAVDRTGKWLFRRGQIVLPKGAGKSPLAAALSCCALGAEVIFDGFDAHGEAVGRPHPSPHVQLAAVSQDQTSNTMSLVLPMLREGDAANTLPELDLGLTRIRTRNGRLEPVTASAPSREGQRLTDAILDEPHLWVAANGGTRLAATLRRNLGKMNGRSIETTNCWTPGEGSVAEATAEYAATIAEGKAVDVGLMRYHPQAPVEDLGDERAVRAGLRELYRDSPWVNIDRVVAEIYDLGTHPADARRFYLNQVSVAEDGWLAQHEWAACAAPTEIVADDEAITLGFDGSRSRSRGITDATALIGCRVADGHVFELGIWEQPQGPAGQGWQVPVTEVDAAVRAVMDRYRVVGFYADPARWETWVAAWEADYGSRLQVKASRDHPIEWWMTGGRSGLIVRALEQLHSAVLDREMSHDGGYALTRHVLNARRRATRSGLQIAKEHPDSSRKIDAALAATLAWQARLDALAAGATAPPKQRSRRLHRF
jgi:hypothetical protein